MGFGKRLKEVLKNKGITIKELSKMTGISINTLYSITKRDTSMPDQEIINKITNALKIEKSELISLDVISEDLKDALVKLKQDEGNLRKDLYKFSEMLSAEALIQLNETAIELLKDESNISIFYNNSHFNATDE